MQEKASRESLPFQQMRATFSMPTPLATSTHFHTYTHSTTHTHIGPDTYAHSTKHLTHTHLARRCRSPTPASPHTRSRAGSGPSRQACSRWPHEAAMSRPCWTCSLGALSCYHQPHAPQPPVCLRVCVCVHMYAYAFTLVCVCACVHACLRANTCVGMRALAEHTRAPFCTRICM